MKIGARVTPKDKLMNDFHIHPCPFCGSQDVDIQTSTEDREGVPTNLFCVECGAAGPWAYMRPDATIENVVIETGWNNRHNSF